MGRKTQHGIVARANSLHLLQQLGLETVCFSPLLEDQNGILIQIKTEWFCLKTSKVLSILSSEPHIPMPQNIIESRVNAVESLYQSECQQKIEALVKD